LKIHLFRLLSSNLSKLRLNMYEIPKKIDQFYKTCCDYD